MKNQDLINFNVIVEESDCYFSALNNLQSKARKSIIKYRAILKKYIASHPEFLTTLEPFKYEPEAPLIVKAMSDAGSQASVGPMAAVAGAIAQFAGEELSRYSAELIIENGGDIYIHSQKARLLGIFAGNSPLSGKIAVEINPVQTPMGISTSSGTVGHSLSFGNADAVVILADTAILSDAVATCIGNLVQTVEDIPGCLERSQNIKGVYGTLIIKDDKMGLLGDIQIRATDLLPDRL